jgi:large subunit ribosomal protein L22
VRISGKKLKKQATDAGVSVADVASVIERTGLSGDRAESAVRNWMSGRDHPRCKASDIERIAERLGCPVAAISSFTSSVNNTRGSTRKARLVADLVRGRAVDDALNVLTFSTKRAAVNIKKALTAAIADAEQADADVTALYVSESHVDEGAVMKRFRPKDRGRAHAILKQTSHITISVEEKA